MENVMKCLKKKWEASVSIVKMFSQKIFLIRISFELQKDYFIIFPQTFVLPLYEQLRTQNL